MTVIELGKQNRDTVVLLHGGGLSWWSYRKAAQLLAEDHHVILPILDGHGGSTSRFTTIEANAERIIEYIDANLSGRTTTLCGLSLGGQIVLEILTQRPHICQFAMIESALAKPSKLTRTLIAPSVTMSYGLIKQRWFAKLQAQYLGIPGELFDDYYRDTCKITKADMIAFLEANSVYSLKSALAETSAKVKIIAGGREQKSILDSAKLIHSVIPGSQIEIIPRLRHGDLSINQPERYSHILRQWSKKT